MNEAAPVVSIIIPAFNRAGPLRGTLASARQAIESFGESAEIVLVDDGSEPPLSTQLASEFGGIRCVRQANQGSIVARLTGLQTAKGEFVLFLDSDDWIAPEKLTRHVARFRAAPADITYDDVGQPVKDATGDLGIQTTTTLPRVGSVEELLLSVQPLPHGPIYRREYLHRALASPVVPPLRQLDPVGDVWLYYNLCLHRAAIAKVDGAMTWSGVHDENRYSQHWERLGAAALGLMEEFTARCPITPETENARRMVGEIAFIGWRRLPRGLPKEIYRRRLDVWRRAPRSDIRRLGGPFFRILASVLGPVTAASLLRLSNPRYETIRTIDDTELARLLPPPPNTSQSCP